MDIGIHLLHSTFGTIHHRRSRHLLFMTRSVLGHVVLAFCCLVLSLHRLVVGVSLITFLSTHDPFIKKTLNTLVGFLGNVHARLGLLHQLISSLHLFLTGTVVSHLLLGGSGILGTTGLLHLSLYLRSIENSQRVAHFDEVALFDSDFQDTSRHLA